MTTYSEECGFVFHRLSCTIPGYGDKSDILYWQGKDAPRLWGKKETAKIIRGDYESELEWQNIKEVYDYPEAVYWEYIWREVEINGKKEFAQ